MLSPKRATEMGEREEIEEETEDERTIQCRLQRSEGSWSRWAKLPFSRCCWLGYNDERREREREGEGER